MAAVADFKELVKVEQGAFSRRFYISINLNLYVGAAMIRIGHPQQ